MTIEMLQTRVDIAWQMYAEASEDLIMVRKVHASERCIRFHEARATRWYAKACDLENDLAWMKEDGVA